MFILIISAKRFHAAINRTILGRTIVDRSENTWKLKESTGSCDGFKLGRLRSGNIVNHINLMMEIFVSKVTSTVDDGIVMNPVNLVISI